MASTSLSGSAQLWRRNSSRPGASKTRTHEFAPRLKFTWYCGGSGFRRKMCNVPGIGFQMTAIGAGFRLCHQSAAFYDWHRHLRKRMSVLVTEATETLPHALKRDPGLTVVMHA